MKNKIKILIASLTLLLTPMVVTGVFMSQNTNAAPIDLACDGLRISGQGSGNCSRASGDSGFRQVVTSITNILTIVVGAVSVIMIIIGGFRYVLSNGDSNATSGAKNTILYAIIGLIVVLFAQVIVAFVINRA